MEMIIGILASLAVRLMTGKIVSQVMVVFAKAWAEHTVNKYDDELVSVFAVGLGVEIEPMKQKLKEQAGQK